MKVLMVIPDGQEDFTPIMYGYGLPDLDPDRVAQAVAGRSGLEKDNYFFAELTAYDEETVEWKS